MNYLASPAAGHRVLAGRDDGLRLRRPTRWGSRRGQLDLPARTSADRRTRCSPRSTASIDRRDVHQGLRRRVHRRRAVARRCRPPRATRSSGTRSRPTCASPRTSRACRPSRRRSWDFHGARVLAKLGDSVTTDHISPAGSIKADSPAGLYLHERGVEQSRLQQLRLPPRQPRGDDPRHVRQRPDAQEAAGRRRRRRHRPPPTAASRRASTTPRSATRRPASRWWCWAARSTARARRATGRPRAPPARREGGDRESYERIHRSNLIGMGVLPLQFPEGERAESLGLDGTETFDIAGRHRAQRGHDPAHRARDRDQADGAARRSRSTRWSASTPPARRTTTATAGSCSTCCARCP